MFERPSGSSRQEVSQTTAAKRPAARKIAAKVNSPASSSPKPVGVLSKSIIACPSRPDYEVTVTQNCEAITTAESGWHSVKLAAVQHPNALYREKGGAPPDGGHISLPLLAAFEPVERAIIRSTSTARSPACVAEGPVRHALRSPSGSPPWPAGLWSRSPGTNRGSTRLSALLDRHRRRHAR